MKKRYYSFELKEQAVRLSYQRENIQELADELGIERSKGLINGARQPKQLHHLNLKNQYPMIL